MVNGAVFLFAPKVVVQVVQVAQNKKSKKSQNFLTDLMFCRILIVAQKNATIIQPYKNYKNYKMSLREKSKIVCTSSVYAISVPKN